MLEVIILAGVAAFILYRLRAALGRRTGHERPPPESFPRPQPTPGASGRKEDQTRERDRAPGDGRSPGGSESGRAPTPLDAALAEVRAADPGFDPDDFATGAKAAYEMIVTAFATGDKDVLKPLLAEETWRGFEAAIDARAAAGQVMTTTIIGVKSAEIVEATLRENVAEVTVKFVADIVSVTRGPDDRIVDGHPSESRETTDLWTFSRNVRSSDPNWELVATRSEA